jgi:DNA-binding CsgD family transcriptional regulator/PAS domain-containing protein
MEALPEPVARAINRVYEAGFETELWHEALAALCRSVGAYAAVTVPRLAAQNTLLLPSTVGMQDLLRTYVEEEWHKRDLRAERGWPLADAGRPVVLEQDIVTPDDHKYQPLYQDFSRRFGVLWWAGITFRSLDQQYVLSLYRRTDQEPFTEADRQLFGHLTGHLSRAITMAERLAAATAMGGVDVLQAMDHGGILVDARARVIAANPRAEAMLGDGLSIFGNRLVARRAECEAALQGLIARTLRGGPQAEGAIAIRRPLRRPILIDAMPVPLESRTPFLFAKALLVLVDLDARPVPTEATLMRLFALSRREAALAMALASGGGLNDAAELLGITRETARSHLKAVFAKTETRRQTDLMALIQRARPITP